jgi:hypothetical protein
LAMRKEASPDDAITERQSDFEPKP